MYIIICIVRLKQTKLLRARKMRFTTKGYIIGSIVGFTIYVVLTFGLAKIANNVVEKAENRNNEITKILRENQ